MKRKDFIGIAATASIGSMLPAWQTLKPEINKMSHKASYQLMVLATNWGFQGSINEFCAAAKNEGYDGIEVWWPSGDEERKLLFGALQKHSLQVGFLTAGNSDDPVVHLKTFKENVLAITGSQFQKPLYINCHSGHDFFTPEQNQQFISFTTQQAIKSGIPIYHETHRGRMMFAAPVTRHFIEKNPDLKLTLDISHWCNVHESLLQNQKENVAAALERTHHIHARVGHPEGPQVNDPRAPEWKEVVKQHFDWWDVVVSRKKQTGGVMTFLTEFGPETYMPALPYTRQPVANQWEINVHMLHELKKRYQ